MSNETPLEALEKDCVDFRKEVEENIKNWTKITLKSSNNDPLVYRQNLEEALTAIEDHRLEANDLLLDANELSQANEPTIKAKDFQKRQNSEIKKLKDIQEKIEKSIKKLNSDLDKQIKAEEKRGVVDSKKKGEKTGKDTEKDAEKDTDVDKNETDEATKVVTESKKEKEKRAKDEKLKKTDESTGKKNEELIKMVQEIKAIGLREEKKNKEVEKWSNDESQNEVHEDEVKTKELTIIAKSVIDIEENRSTSSGQNQELVKIVKEIKAIESRYKAEEATGSADKSPKAVPVTVHVPGVVKPKLIENVSSGSGQNQELVRIVKEIKAIGLREEEELNKLEKEIDDIEKGMEEDYEEEDEITPEPEKAPERKKIMKPDEFAEGQKLQATVDIEPEEEGDLKVKKNEILTFLDYEDDPAWLEVETSTGKTGFVPRSKVREYNEDDESIIEEEAKPEKKSNKWKLSKPKLKLGPDALKQSGSVPSTFSEANLPSLADDYSYDTFLAIGPTKSNLNFKNFYWEAKENRLRNKLVQFQKLFVVHKCVNIPVPNKADLTVLSRTLNVCLFDGVSILSNIHTIRAHVVGKDEKTWSFEDEVSEAVSISDLSEFFIRSNVVSENNIGVLFELSVYCKMNSTGEESELCCGWAHLPFKDPVTKQQVANKSYDLVLNGGSIFDKKKPLDPSGKSGSGGAWNDLIAKMFKESKLKLNVKEPSNLFFEILGCLPEPLVVSSLTAPFIKYYREEIGLEFLAPLIENGSFDANTEPIHSCFLSTFSEALKQPDILDAVRFAFQLARENMKRDERNDNHKLRKTFVKTYNETCYPLLNLADFPEFDLKNHENLEIRRTMIQQAAKLVKKQNLLKYLLDGSVTFKPFNMDEIRFEILA